MTENTLPQELKKWVNERAKKEMIYVDAKEDYHYDEVNLDRYDAALNMATALYAHIKPLIDEKHAEIAKLRQIIGNDFKGVWTGHLSQISELQSLLDAKDEEIERLVSILKFHRQQKDNNENLPFNLGDLH